jgi:4-hydroxy-2-oxoheptanedioate aldolase
LRAYQVDAIAKVDGIDVLLVGPYDLGNNLGHPVTGDFAPELKTAIETIRKAAASAGKKSAIYATSGEQARAYADQGFNMVFSHPCMPSLSAVVDGGICRSLSWLT